MKQIIAGAALLLAGCMAQAQDKFLIKGKLSAIKQPVYVVLVYVNGDNKVQTDSTLIKNGQFQFSGPVDGAMSGTLSMAIPGADTASGKRKAARDAQGVFLEKGTTTVTGTDKLATAVVKGGAAQKENELLQSQIGSYSKLMYHFVYEAKPKDADERKLMRDSMNTTMATLAKIKDSFIYAHPDSYISLGLMLEKTTHLDLANFQPLYDRLSKRVLSCKRGQVLTEKLNIAIATAPGKAIDFTQADTAGNPFTLSTLRGKYVLVDFWASWCKPCRAENPNVVKAYNEFKSKNFEIVSVSLDGNKQQWVDAIAKDGMPWIHVCDMKGWKNELALKYNISAVPQNFLIDPKGVIIAKNLRGEELGKKLKEIIN